MASVYILFSNALDKFYCGSCKDLEYRLDQHFNKKFKKSFTSKVSDWKLFFFIDNLEFQQARAIEQHIKKMKSRTYILNLKKYSEMIEKLKMKYK